MAEGFLLTVGASSDSEIYAIRELKPEFVAFICTEDSRIHIDRIVHETGLNPSCYNIYETKDSPDEIGKLVLKAHEAFRWLEQKCGENLKITINPTAGRKWMSAGLSLFGSRTCARQIYVDVIFREGKPDPNTMKLVDLGDAQDYTGLLDADLGIELFNRFDFEGASQVFSSIKPKSCSAKSLYSGLTGLADTLHRWDRFEHYNKNSNVSLKGAEYLSLIKSACNDLQITSFEKFISDMERLLGKIREVESESQLNLQVIADLVQNAQRHISTGRVDDGVARLYRALEAAAQFLLLKKGINTDKVDWNLVSPEQIASFRKTGRLQEQHPLPTKLPLAKSFALARSLVIPGSELFFNPAGDFAFLGQIEWRNTSILAHGMNPVDRDRAIRFFEKLIDIFKTLGCDFSGLDIPKMPRLWT